MLNDHERELKAQALDWFDAHRDEYVRDLIRWASVPSVSDASAARPGEPYGKGVADMFEQIASTAADYGFVSVNHDGYAMSVYANEADKSSTSDIAILSHADVVPAGPGWLSEPFQPYERDGYVVGRGVHDDKAMCVLAVFLMRFLREQGITLDHTLRLMYGGAEETGLHDMEHYVAEHGAPYRTLVTDCGFPVNYAQKGEITFECALPLPSAIESITAGVAPNAVPGEAFMVARLSDGGIAGDGTAGDATDSANGKNEAAIRALADYLASGTDDGGSFELESSDDGRVRIKAIGRSGHGAVPQLALNAVHVLAEKLAADDDPALSADARAFLADLDRWIVPPFGDGFGFAFEDEDTGKTTCNLGVVTTDGRELKLTFDIRYAVTQSADDIMAAIEQSVAAAGGRMLNHTVDKPYYVPKDNWEVTTLVAAYDDVTGIPAEPFSTGGGTHSRVVPRSINFGPGFPEDPESIVKLTEAGLIAPQPTFVTNGGAHGANECMSVLDFRNAFPIFVIGLLRYDAALSDHE